VSQEGVVSLGVRWGEERNPGEKCTPWRASAARWKKGNMLLKVVEMDGVAPPGSSDEKRGGERTKTSPEDSR